MLFHNLLGEATGVDLEQIVCTIRGALDADAFVAAFHAVAARHEILRTRFSYDAMGRPVQEVVEAVEIPLRRVDLCAAEEADRLRRFEEILSLDRAEAVDLDRAPAMRLLVVDLSPDDHRVLWTFHHVLLDGRSFPVVLREVFEFYAAMTGARELDLPTPRPYREYIEFLRGLDLSAAEAFWRHRLSGFSVPTPLGVDRPTGDHRHGAIQGVSERRLSPATTAALREFAATQRVTLNTLLQTAWAVLLSRYSGEEDVVFGATRACRRSAFPDADEMVGLFINTLPLRVRVNSERHLAELLKEVRAQQVGMREYEHTPLVKVQGWSDVPRGRTLFDTILVYEESSLDETLRALDPEGSRLAFSYHGQTNYALTLVAYGDAAMLVRLENDRRRVDDAPAARMLVHLVTILTAMPEHADRKLHDLSLLSGVELSGVGGVGLVVGGGGGGCLHERFVERVGLGSGRVAVVCGGESLSFGELDRRANALALRLRGLGVGPDVVVGLRCERSLAVVVGVLGVLKAGGAYLPLDPAYPRERVEFMLADSGVGVVVTESGFVSDFGGSGVELVLVEECGEAEEAPVSGVGPENLAYVIYTSGSTGRPKGVLISHRNVTRLFDSTEEWFGFDETDVWTLFHSYAFDFSVWELWGALLYGGRLVVVPYWVSRSPEEFRELVLREGVTVLNQTPTAFRQFVAADLQAGAPAANALRYVIFGGEALELSSLRPWFDRYGDARPQLVNMYGITETTVHVTYRPITLADLEAGAGSVIGVPLPDLRLLVLDAHGAPAPIGVAGEIYVGGAGVSRGYLNRPQLTAERFVADPLGGPGTLYRSGDLARRLENGELEYLGRIDDQVKIHGFRIELGEIEALLNHHPDVTDAVVIVREDSPDDKRLLAYIVAPDQPPTLIDSLKAQLKAQLPPYMIPTPIVPIDSLPLTTNGKLDRDALPTPDRPNNHNDTPHIPPRTPTEQTLTQIWTDVLNTPQISITDNFFELGGDSILTIQIIARCRQAGLSFTPLDLAKRPTIAELAEVLAPSAAPAEADREPAAGPMTPTPIQSWFFEQRFADASHWNQAFLLETPPDIDVDSLQQALGHVMAHHDALRMRVAWHEGRPTISGDPDAPTPSITCIDLTEAAPDDHPARIEAAATAAQSQLNLERGPLLGAVFFDRGAAPGRLLLAVHHLAVDGVSWRILVEDLEAAYRAQRTQSPVLLPPRSASFHDWARALVDYAGAAELEESLARWLEIEAGDATLPANGSGHGDNTEATARSVTVSLGREETQALLQRVPAAYSTQINEVLLTALALALRGWTGRDVHRIDMEGHGREEWIGPLDVSRTVGWFTTLYPVKLDLEGASDEGAALKRVKERLRLLPERGLSHGILRYGSVDPAVSRKLANGRSELLFNYLGQFDQVVAGSDMFAFADEPTGAWHGPANERTHRLEVLAAVRDGCFEARWIYGSERDREEVVRRVAEDFIGALRRLIDHCTQPGLSGHTPSDFPLARLEQEALDRIIARYPDLEDVYPLSPMQLLFLSMEAGRSGFEQWVFRLRGALDAPALRSAWETTVARHGILRTAFVSDGPAEPMQVVQRRATLPWAQEDWSAVDAARREDDLRALLRSDRERAFDVGVAPLCRLTLIRTSEDEHQLVWSTHHLCVDGWSWPLIFRDIGVAYEARLERLNPQFGDAAQYRDYIGWLGEAAPDSRDFWKKRLAGFRSPTPLPFEPSPGQLSEQEPREASTSLDVTTTVALQSLARELRVTLNTLVHGSWAILLGHVSGRDEVIFGAAFSGRPAELPGIETLVGPCVNNLPVRVPLEPKQPVSAWFAELHERNLELAQHQYASLSEIQRWADVPWRLRLFDSLVVFQNYQLGEAVLRWGEVGLEPVASPDETAYPLTLTVTPGAEIGLRLSGRGDRFAPATLAMMLGGLARVLSGLVRQPESSLAEIEESLLPASTKGAAAEPPAPVARPRQPSYVPPGNEMERVVASVWEELFQVEEIGIEDNFFDLGGHSVMLIEAHARLRNTVRDDLPILALLQYPTVRALARYLSEGEATNAALGAVRDRAVLQRQALARRKRPLGTQ
jgi:amino acid adenylation domain-containing protein/non-ribosomal peptide synthase protein (TIGR01720 family)